MICPACEADLGWTADQSITPATTEHQYHCPDPDCEVGLVAVIEDD